jgi:hypothetical protein
MENITMTKTTQITRVRFAFSQIADRNLTVGDGVAFEGTGSRGRHHRWLRCRPLELGGQQLRDDPSSHVLCPASQGNCFQGCCVPPRLESSGLALRPGHLQAAEPDIRDPRPLCCPGCRAHRKTASQMKRTKPIQGRPYKAVPRITVMAHTKNIPPDRGEDTKEVTPDAAHRTD